MFLSPDHNSPQMPCSPDEKGPETFRLWPLRTVEASGSGKLLRAFELTLLCCFAYWLKHKNKEMFVLIRMLFFFKNQNLLNHNWQFFLKNQTKGERKKRRHVSIHNHLISLAFFQLILHLGFIITTTTIITMKIIASSAWKFIDYIAVSCTILYNPL